MKIKKFGDNPYGQNSYLLSDYSDALIIDPGMNAPALLEELKNKELKVKAILLTHGHFDHIFGIMLLEKEYPSPIYIHESEAKLFLDNDFNYASMFGRKFDLSKDITIIPFKHLDEINISSFKVKVHHTPGHTAGSSCFQVEGNLFTGDTLFSMGVGRTDLMTGNLNALRKSLDYIFSSFSTKTMVYPGHEQSNLLKNIEKMPI